MVLYRSYYFLQRRDWTILILDVDKTIITVEPNLSSAKKFVDMVNDSTPSIEAVNEFASA